MKDTVTVVSLGWCVAKIDLIHYPHRLTIFSPSVSSDGCLTPAQDVVVCGDGIIALRDALNAIELRQPQKWPPGMNALGKAIG